MAQYTITATIIAASSTNGPNGSVCQINLSRLEIGVCFAARQRKPANAATLQSVITHPTTRRSIRPVTDGWAGATNARSGAPSGIRSGAANSTET